ncbi:MAG: hypothetical protein M3Q29_08135 [Chloroflexota bacterium]|nr:hypothetical protein [Chloroflexota bacterium]
MAKVRDVQLYAISMGDGHGGQEEVATMLTWSQMKAEVRAWEDPGGVGGIEASHDTMIQIYATGVAWECACSEVVLSGDECPVCGEEE